MRIPPLTPSAPSPGTHSKTVVIDCDTPETYPPWPCTTPLGLPVLPEVYDTKSGWSLSHGSHAQIFCADLNASSSRRERNFAAPADATHRFAPHLGKSTRAGAGLVARTFDGSIGDAFFVRPFPFFFVRSFPPFGSFPSAGSLPSLRLRASIAD